VDDEIILDKARKEIRKHFKPCPKKLKSEDGTESTCGSLDFNSAGKDDTRARQIAAKKAGGVEGLEGFRIVANPSGGLDDVEKAWFSYREYLRTIEDESHQKEKIDNTLNFLTAHEVEQNESENEDSDLQAEVGEAGENNNEENTKQKAEGE
jgi:hypothetical protein